MTTYTVIYDDGEFETTDEELAEYAKELAFLGGADSVSIEESQ